MRTLAEAPIRPRPRSTMPSTVISWIRYHPDSRRLLVGFRSGRRYAYEDVPAEVHAALRTAASRGAYFNEYIRDRYAYARLEDEDAA